MTTSRPDPSHAPDPAPADDAFRTSSQAEALRRVVMAGCLLAPLPVWPYWCYVVLRWGVSFAALAVILAMIETHRRGWAVLFAGVLIVFNPLWPVYLDLPTWIVLDLLTAALFWGVDRHAGDAFRTFYRVPTGTAAAVVTPPGAPPPLPPAPSASARTPTPTATPTATPLPTRSPTTAPPSPSNAARPTATPRAADAVDVEGLWRLRSPALEALVREYAAHLDARCRRVMERHQFAESAVGRAAWEAEIDEFFQHVVRREVPWVESLGTDIELARNLTRRVADEVAQFDRRTYRG